MSDDPSNPTPRGEAGLSTRFEWTAAWLIGLGMIGLFASAVRQLMSF